MRLGKRLRQLDRMITAEYNHIWDCCCDHGLLGATLLQRSAAAHIHFVDIVPELINELTVKLRRFAQPNSQVTSQWHTHCLDVAKLPLTHFTGKHLLVIAGVGGDLSAELVESICAAHPHLELEFLLCPVRQQFLLRQQLIELECKLLKEVLISENHRHYEVLHVQKPALAQPTNNGEKQLVHKVGEALWHASTQEHAHHLQTYLANTLRHYQAAGNQTAATAYQAVRITYNE